MDFRHAIRMYQQDLAAGRYDPEWLRQAAEAMEQRANGDFDKWKENEFEEFWGQKQKLDSKARAGQSGTVKLNRLVEAGLFKEGDIFSYMRTFGRGKGKLTVEKDVKVCYGSTYRLEMTCLLIIKDRLSRSMGLRSLSPYHHGSSNLHAVLHLTKQRPQSRDMTSLDRTSLQMA